MQERTNAEPATTQRTKLAVVDAEKSEIVFTDDVNYGMESQGVCTWDTKMLFYFKRRQETPRRQRTR